MYVRHAKQAANIKIVKRRVLLIIARVSITKYSSGYSIVIEYNYQLDATLGANYPIFIQISGRIPVLIRHFSMDIQLPLGATVKIETLEQAVDLFVTDGMPARNLSPRTRVNYRHDLFDLLAFLKDRGTSYLSDISLRHLEAYQAEMDRRGYSS